MATIRCTRCKRITGTVDDGTLDTTYTYEPRPECLEGDRVTRDRAAAVRRRATACRKQAAAILAELAAKAGSVAR